MFVYEGVSQLRVALNVVDDRSMNKFPVDAFCQKLVNVIKQPVIMEEISNEIKFMAIQSLVSILDIFPHHVGYLIQLGLAAAIKEAMETSAGSIDLQEQCIKCCEKVSQDHPRSILKQGIVPVSVNMIDFFDRSIQTKVWNLLLNVSGASESPQDFRSNLLPCLPTICQMLSNGVQSESDKPQAEKLSTILSKICGSFVNFDDFEQISSLYDDISNAGIHETIVEQVIKYSQFVSQKPVKPDNQQQISTDPQTTYSELTISNFLRVLQYSCQFSHQVVMQLTSAGIFEILNPLLPSKPEEDATQLIADVLSLLQSMLPVSSPEQLSEKDSFRKQYENEKCEFYSNQETQLLQSIGSKLLPKIFIAYSQQINTKFRIQCLDLISRIMLVVIPSQLLAQSLKPQQLTKFIHQILKQQQPQQVLLCLQTVHKLLQQCSSELEYDFTRHGIRETIKEYTQEETIKHLNKFEEIKEQLPSGLFGKDKVQMLKMTVLERDKVSQRVEAMNGLLEQVQDTKRDELQRVVHKYEETIKQLDLKIKELEKQTGVDTMVQEVSKRVMYGDRIAEIASLIMGMEQSREYPEQIEWFTKLKQIGGDLDIDQLADVLVSSNQITSFEFEQSGLLNAIQKYLTCKTSSEESKQESVDGVEYMTRLKKFVDVMVQKRAGLLPFKQLFDLCHEQVTLAEPVLFKDQHHGSADSGQQALNQLQRSVVVNLVYQPQQQFQGIQADYSQVYQQRESLFKQLQEIPLNIMRQDSIQLLDDFLKKRVKSQAEVQALLQQTQRHLGPFGKQAKKQTKAQVISQQQHSKQMGEGEQEVLLDRLMERLGEFLDECLDQDVFTELEKEVTVELSEMIIKSEQDCQGARVDPQFYKNWSDQTQQMIQQIAYQESQEFDQNDIPHDEMELMVETLAVKTASFLKLILSVQQQVQADRPSDKQSLSQIFSSIVGNNTPKPTEKEEETKIQDTIQKQVSSESANVSESDDPVPKQIETLKPAQLINKAPEVSLAELLKSNEDVDIEFYYNKKRIEPNTSFFEIFKEPQDKPQSKEKPSQFKDMMFQLTGGLHDFRTISFMMKDRVPNQIKEELPSQIQRKDSLIDYTQIRQRTKSQYIEEVSAKSVNTLAQSLIDDFAVNLTGDEVTTLEHTLKILKVLWYIHQNQHMFLKQGINFLLSGSLDFEKSDDMAILQLQNEMGQNCFDHAKLDFNFQKAILDPYKMLSGGVNETLKVIFASCSFLFSFETKMLYLRLVSFIQIDVQRSLQFLKLHLSRNGKKQIVKEERKDKQIERQKVKVDRSTSLTEQALKFMKDVRKKAVLEINYTGEEGTGLGPTLEFYSLLGVELASDKTMWRQNTVDGSLYPKCLQITEENQDEVKMVCDKFYLAGFFVGKSILDDRLIDLPLSELMWDLIFEKKKSLYDLNKLDSNMFTLFSELQLMANEKQQIDQDLSLSQEQRQTRYDEIKSQKNSASLDDYGLSFYNPSDENVELVKDGANIKVTLDNLQSYIDMVIDSTFNESIRLQVSAFRKGFNLIFNIENLKIFQSLSELETLVCGEAMESQLSVEWTDPSKLTELVSTAHGYTPKSKGFLLFLRYVTELSPKERPMFVQFLTGSPRLPIGGFGALEPRLTVVLKKPESHQNYTSDQILPSVMTCQNYLKLPEYSSYEILKQKFDTAVMEGGKHFGMA